MCHHLQFTWQIVPQSRYYSSFQQWQFEEWKRKNMYNPDQEYIDNYNYDMNLMKNRLLERRRILQQKVEQEEKEERERANPLAAASSNIEVMKNLNDSIMDVVKEAFETPLKEKRVEFESRWNSGKEPEPEIVDIPTGNVRPKQPAGSALFLPSSSSTSGRKDSLPGKVVERLGTLLKK